MSEDESTRASETKHIWFRDLLILSKRGAGNALQSRVLQGETNETTCGSMSQLA